MDILLAASKSENIESRQDALDAVGLKTKVVDVEAFAIANAFELIRERDHLSKNEAVGIFDIGRDLTTLLVLRGGRVIYNREHPFGGHQLLEETMRRYEMTPEQASFFERGEDGPEDWENRCAGAVSSSILSTRSAGPCSFLLPATNTHPSAPSTWPAVPPP